ncbi:hypothetical protein [Streptomyces sp. DSM 41534]
MRPQAEDLDDELLEGIGHFGNSRVRVEPAADEGGLRTVGARPAQDGSRRQSVVLTLLQDKPIEKTTARAAGTVTATGS